MSTSTKYLTGLVSMIALAGGVVNSPAALAAETSNNQLEEVMVTASRREESLQDVAISMTVLDQEEFARGGITTINDMLPFVPGVAVVDSAIPFGSNVIVRGINATGAAGVGNYIDDISYGSSTVYNVGGLALDGVLLDLDHMEVLKGPQGTLYGASAMGGLLKFQTRDPSLEEWSGNISADLSSTRHGGLNQLYRVSANGPLATDTVGLSFTAFWKDKTGFIDNVTVPFDGVDSFEYYGGSAALLLVPTDNMSVKLQAVYQKSTLDGGAQISANSLDDFPLPGLAAGEPWVSKFEDNAADVIPILFESKVVGATIDYDFGWANFTSITSYQDVAYSASQDVGFAFNGLADLFFPANAPHTRAIFIQGTGFKKTTQEIRLTSPSNQKFEWLAGGFWSEEDGFNSQFVDLTPPDPFIDLDIPAKYTDLAFFATGTYYFTPDFDASFGVRHSQIEADMEITSRGHPAFVVPVPKTIDKSNVTTYLFNMRYRPTDNMAIYGRAASGYRPGGANAVGLDLQGNPLAPPFFLADELWSYEIGVKGSTPDGRISYDMAAFYIDWRDYQIGVSRNGLNVIGNATEASSKGAEASFSLAASDALVFNATVSYTDAKLDVDEPDLGGAKGDQTPNSPKWSASAGFNYDFNLGNLPAFVAGTYRYNGKFPVGFDGVTIDGTFFQSSVPRYINDSYSVVDLRAGFSTERFEASVYVTNLLNEYAYTNFGTSRIGPGIASLLRPQTVGMVLKAYFN